jgi:hypothetical protein
MPGKGAFKRCVKSVSRKGSAADPRAVCAASIAAKRGRTKGRVNARYSAYGKALKRVIERSFPGKNNAALRAAIRKNIIDASEPGSYILPSEAVAGIANTTALTGSGRAALQNIVKFLESKGNPDAHARNVRGMTKNERALMQAGKRMALAHVAPAAMFLGNKGKKKRKGNPGGDPAAAQAYKEFHGREADRISRFKSVHHFPKYTVALGDLIELQIRIPKGRVEGGRIVTLADFDGAWLTRHPRLKQLYVEGGDQSLDLAEFGLDPRDARERVFLGELTRCVYFTRKDHLGSEGGTANYHHRFGKNELTLEKTELVQVSYHVPDEQLEFSGGTFEIPAEGIDG